MDRRNRVHGVVSRKQAEMVAKKVGMTTEKVQELQDTFYVFDQNGDGMITTDELATVLFKLGQRPTLREVQAMIKSVDADKSGTIDFDEFVKIFAQKMSIDPEKELHEIFCVFDKNKDGFISSEELYEVLSKLGESITKDEAYLMIKEADLDRDGKVNYTDDTLKASEKSVEPFHYLVGVYK